MATMEKTIKEGCKVYFACVLDVKELKVKLEDISRVKEFPDVFLDELSELLQD